MQKRDRIFPCFVFSVVSFQRSIDAAGACRSVFGCLFTRGNSYWEKKESDCVLPSFVGGKDPQPLMDKFRLEQVEQQYKAATPPYSSGEVDFQILTQLDISRVMERF